MGVTGNLEGTRQDLKTKQQKSTFFLNCLSEGRLGKYFLKFYILIPPLSLRTLI